MAGAAGFMEKPLAVWAQSFQVGVEVTYQDLINGSYLNDVMHEIDPRAASEVIVRKAADLKDRIQNWNILMRNIRSYYQEVLQQLIVMKLPNIMVICREPDSDAARDELEKVLLLVLGCAVQCEHKEHFVAAIQELEIEIQEAIVERIQEITDSRKSVFGIELSDHMQLPELTQVVFGHLRTVIEERDGYVEEIKELTQNLEELYALQQTEAVTPQKRPPTPSSVSPEKHHLAVELAECKAKMRKLRQEYEEKCELAAELQDDLDEHKTMVLKLRSENVELVGEARQARAYRDELDILKDKASRVEKYEAEITKYRQKLTELEFYKTRVEELREENEILVETKHMMEDQITSSQKRFDTVIELENELMKARQLISEISSERDQERMKLQDALEENARLEFEKKSSFNESATLEEELIRARSQLHTGLNNSISDQFNETANAKVLRLELENNRLQKQLTEMRDKEIVESASKTLELEKENHRLAKKVEKLQESTSKETQNFINLEQATHNLKREKEELQQTIETVKESNERQILELERENQQLSQQVETLRERNEQSHDLRMKEIENENKRLHESVKEFTSKVSNLDYENRTFQKSYERLEDKVEQMQQLEEYSTKMEKEAEGLHKKVATLKLTCDKYEKLEQDFSDLEVENEKLTKVVSTLRNQVNKMDALEQDNINLTVETQHLKRAVENAKNSTSRVADLEHAKEELNREIAHLQKMLEATKLDRNKIEQLENNLLELDTENQKLQRQHEGALRRAEQLENDLTEMEQQNDQLQKSIDAMKMSVRRLEELEKENKEVEYENINLHKDKSVIEKENKRLKNAVELKETALEDATNRINLLEKENKNLSRSMGKQSDYSSRIHELERENMEFFQQAEMDKRTLCTLREDLVNEKISTQQLSTELDKVSSELEKVGVNRQALVAAEDSESKYKALETMMEDALQKRIQIKDEKISALESRLEESKSRNSRLQEELKQVKCNYEALQQRREEEVSQTSSARERSPPRPQATPSYQNATKDILELKDHLITVERNNATLEAECRNLRSNSTSLSERLSSSETSASDLKKQISQLTNQNQSLQSKVAEAQVEIRTFESQLASLHSQTEYLQSQNTSLSMERERLTTRYEDLTNTHSSLSADHDALQRLHEQLTLEYEALISEHGSLKANFKALKIELKEAQEQMGDINHEKKTLNELKSAISEDREHFKNETKSMGTLQIDLLHLKEENIRLKSIHEKLSNEYRELLNEHKTTKSDYNQLCLKHTELQGNFADCRDQLNALDVEVSKMASRCEALSQLNTKLEEENRTLMMQLQALLTQNQEMLTQSLENKDHFHEETRAYMEKLAGLQRQKEKLEEKIMEQYKRYDPVKKKNRSFGANLVRKARGFITRANRSKERNRSASEYDSPENSSLGSENFESSGDASAFVRKNEGNEDAERSLRERHGSAGDLLQDTPKLGKQKKSLAKSTTALNVIAKDNKSAGFKLRGAKSSDNLLSPETPKSRRKGETKDSDSLSSSNSSNRNVEWPSRPPRRRQLQSTSIGNIYQAVTNDRSPRSDDESEEEITLEQFLTESNRSPASRRKLLLNKRIDPDQLNQEDLDTIPVLPPPNFLTPRKATLDEEKQDEVASPKARRRLPSSRSEFSLEQISNIDTDLTSTPKYTENGGHHPGEYGSRQRSQSRPELSRDRSFSRPDFDNLSQSLQRPMSRPELDQRPQSRPDMRDWSSSRPDNEQRSQSRPDLNHPPQTRPDLNQRPHSRAEVSQGYSSRPDMNQRPQSRPELNQRPQSRPDLVPRSPSRPDMNARPVSRGPDVSTRPSRSQSTTDGRPVIMNNRNGRSNSVVDHHTMELNNRSNRSHSDTRPAALPSGDYGRSQGHGGSQGHASQLSSSSSSSFGTNQPPSPNYNTNLHPVPVRSSSLSRKTSDSSQGSSQQENIYATLPRKPSIGNPGWQNNNNTSKNYGDNPPNNLSQSNRSREGQYVNVSLPREPPPYGHEMINGVGPGGDSQYAPGNVRHLVQNFQTIQRAPGGPEPPVPPPRRSRPPTSPDIGGGPSSAFSTPPSYTTININMGSSGGGPGGPKPPPNRQGDPTRRQLPAPPQPPNQNRDEPQNNQPRPGSTPPNPAQGPLTKDGKKNPVWYEYGCV